MASAEVSFKVLILGETRVGKSSILTMLTEKSFTENLPPTLGIDFKLFLEKVDGKEVKLQIWDTAGQERFRTIAETFYRQSDGILVVFDITDLSSFEKVNDWLESLRQRIDQNCVVVLAGNKCDLKDEHGIMLVPEENIRALSEASGYKYFEVSAKKNLNIQACFHHLATSIIAEKRKGKSEEEIKLGEAKAKTRVKCCK